MEVINPEGGKEDAEEEAQRGRWKQEVGSLVIMCVFLTGKLELDANSLSAVCLFPSIGMNWTRGYLLALPERLIDSIVEFDLLMTIFVYAD